MAWDPLTILEKYELWSKRKWTTLVKTKITVCFENQLRTLAEQNSKMIYLNVQLLGLSGIPHIALSNIETTQDSLKLREHLKFLTGDYLTAERISKEQGTDPKCRLCYAPCESIEHILTHCRATSEIYERLLPELLNATISVQPNCSILNTPIQNLTQFILDCTSINLPDSYRIPAHNPRTSVIFKISRDWCYAISKERRRQLRV